MDWENRASMVVHAKPFRSAQRPPTEAARAKAIRHLANGFIGWEFPDTTHPADPRAVNRDGHDGRTVLGPCDAEMMIPG